MSGLDPAGPFFNNKPSAGRLDKTDAKFVDITHTHAGQGLPSLGHANPIGDVDFYPNGGETQPGCGGNMGSRVPDEYGGKCACLKCRHLIPALNAWAARA